MQRDEPFGQDPYCYVKGEDEGRKKDCAIATRRCSWRLLPGVQRAKPRASGPKDRVFLKGGCFESSERSRRRRRHARRRTRCIARAFGRRRGFGATLLNLGFFPMPRDAAEPVEHPSVAKEQARASSRPRGTARKPTAAARATVLEQGVGALCQQARAAAQCGRGRGRCAKATGIEALLDEMIEARALTWAVQKLVPFLRIIETPRSSEIASYSSIAALGDAEDCDLEGRRGSSRSKSRAPSARTTGRRASTAWTVAGGELPNTSNTWARPYSPKTTRETAASHSDVIRFAFGVPLCGKM